MRRGAARLGLREVDPAVPALKTFLRPQRCNTPFFKVAMQPKGDEGENHPRTTSMLSPEARGRQLYRRNSPL